MKPAALAWIWWFAVLLWVPLGRPVVNALRSRGWLTGGAVLMFGVALLVAAVVFERLRRRGRMHRRQVVVALISLGAVALLAQTLSRPEERIHVIQYGILGALVWFVVEGSMRRRFLMATALATIAGYLDEALQWVLPDRVYDTADVLLNAGSGAVGVSLAALTAAMGRSTAMSERRGVPVVVSAPSGGGKTTLCRRVMSDLGGVEFSVSHTTRPRRPKEAEGVDYHFVDDATFDGMVGDGAFLEWANVHGKKYGTSRAQVDGRLAAGIDVFFDIDVQGGRQIAERLDDAVLVFIIPPDMATLEGRLRGRKSDSEEQIQRRLEAARAEIEAASFYTYWIINDDLEQASRQLEAVLVAERLKRVDNAPLGQRFARE